MFVGGGGGVQAGIVGRPPAAIGGGALTKPNGSVIGWDEGGMAAIDGVACLKGLVLRNILGPEGGGPEAPGGPFEGLGCMASVNHPPRDVTQDDS